MFDFITLFCLWFFTAGVSMILYSTKRWKGGIYWFWLWNYVTLSVLAMEVFSYFHLPMWLPMLSIPIVAFFVNMFVKQVDHNITMTKMITKSGSGEPLALQTKFEGRAVVVSYMIGSLSLGVHLWTW